MRTPYLGLCFAVVVGCGAAAPAARLESPIRREGRCVVQGEWTRGELLVPDGSFAFASVGDAQGSVDLGTLPMDARVETDGFSLRGTIDPTHEIRAVPPTALGPSVLVPPGADVSILSVDGDHATIGLGRFAFGDSDAVTWTTRPTASVPCSALGLAFAFRDQESERRERLALGLPIDPPVRHAPPDRVLAIAAQPGGVTEASIAVDAYGLAVRLLQERGAFAQIAIQHWTGATLVGWVAASALVTDAPSDDGQELADILGGIAMGGPVTQRVCQADHALTLSVRRIATRDAEGNRAAIEPTHPIEVGTIAAGSRFVLVEPRADGSAHIEPHHDGHLWADDESEWLVPSGTFACVDETYDATAALRQALGTTE